MNIFQFGKDVWSSTYLLLQISKREILSKYVDSYLGILWAVIEPVGMTLMLSLVFKLGFRVGEIDGVSFFLYMLTGMIVFNFFSSCLAEGAVLVRSYSFLVKKNDFKLHILPITKNISNSFPHAIMLFLLILVLLYNGLAPSFYWVQILYYFFAMNMFLIGLNLLTSSVSVFFPDLVRIIGIVLNIFFYITPIVWSSRNVPKSWEWIIVINPLAYIVDGYRKSLILGVGFWEDPLGAIFFWFLTALLLFVGINFFHKLKPHFADVL